MKIFSFFEFYYNVIRNSPKKYDIAMGHPSGFIAIITPLIIFIVSMSIMFFIPPSFLLLMYLWIPIIVGNFVFVMHVSKQGYAIQREEERKREELRRAKWEQERKERMRRLREEEEVRREAERVRMWEEYCRRHFQQGQRQQQRQQYHQQRQQASHNNSRANAMRLLGLSEGFTEKDVKKAYRRLSKIHHPDTGGTHENFIRLTRAYDYLMNA